MRTILERDRVESHLFICVFFSVLTVKAMLRQPVLGRLAPGLFQLANGLGRTVQHTVGLGGLFPFGAGLVLAMGPQVDRIGHAAKLWRGFAGGKREQAQRAGQWAIAPGFVDFRHQRRQRQPAFPRGCPDHGPEFRLQRHGCAMSRKGEGFFAQHRRNGVGGLPVFKKRNREAA